jgi:hypothetical protein
VGWHVALAVDMDVLVVQWQTGSRKQLYVVQNLRLQLAVVNRRRKAVQIRYEQIDLIVAGVVFGHVNKRQKRAEVIANMKIIIGSQTSQNYGFAHLIRIIP